MRGYTVRTPERVTEAIRLRESGLTYREIGERLGVSLKTACEWVLDSDGSKRDARKATYRGVCVDCGASTFSGDVIPPERCVYCSNASRIIWSAEAIICAIQAWAKEHGGIPPAATDWNPNQAISNGQPEKAERFYADDAWPYVSTVTRVFESWNAAIRAAGFASRSIGTYGRDGEDMSICRKIVERYEAGATQMKLAEEYSCSPRAIQYRIRKAGGQMRSQREAQLLRYEREREAA